MMQNPEQRPRQINVREDIEAQQALLLGIRKMHSHTLEIMGILGKARDMLTAKGVTDQLTGPLVNTGVSTGKAQRYGIDAPISTANVEFFVTALTPSGNVISKLHQVPVGESYLGIVSAAANFTNHEAQQVTRMVEGLQQTKNSGILPNLNAECTSIANPYRATKNK